MSLRSPTESDLSKALIDAAQAREGSVVKTRPEVPYNYYGARGSADLLIRDRLESDHEFSDTVYELKSASAVREATGPNAIAQQFNKLRENFYPGSTIKRPSIAAFELCFVASPTTVAHVLEFESYYETLVNGELGNESRVVLRHPDETRPVCLGKSISLREMARHNNPIVAELLGETE